MAKLHDKETQSIAASVSDVLEGKKSVKEVEEPNVPSGKNGPQTGEKDLKKKHVVKKSGMRFIYNNNPAYFTYAFLVCSLLAVTAFFQLLATKPKYK